VNRITSAPIRLPGTAAFTRADFEFVGVDHSGPSYEARVFIGNAAADETTPATPDAGYAGAFYVFGHGGCYGAPGHCDIHGPIHPYDRRLPHQLTLQTKLIQVTDAIKRLVAAGADTATVTIVAVIVPSPAYDQPPADAPKVASIGLLTYA
jgi:tyrosinase